MFGVHLTREGGLCWETEADGSGREGIRRNENDERASRHATLELGGRVGKKHTFTIPNSYYVPDGRVRLLSPQHWSQTQTTGPERDKCGEYTNGRECVLFWGGGKYKIRIPLGKKDNVATFTMASGFEKFRAFCCEAELDESTRDVIAMPSGLVSDDEEDDEVETGNDEMLTNAWKHSNETNPTPTTHTLDGPSSTPSKGNKQGSNKQTAANGRATHNDRHGTAANDEREHHP
ncbi:hypothetical protein MHU86_15152 [Fragilaria crotonensis]|nr:hypothetical protein MHU86_15152 [Fragilaria crotonensis]